ncbi:hypothetical protein ACRS2S_19905 [Achromobacter xylosoxidans]|uniref:hypothetical protein n=1 Tax=Alcaligenes xylosoxydans xylosoxydans TaxID=85698 RepID=UPI003EE0C267
MNTISASAPSARVRPLRIVTKAAHKLGNCIAPHDHAGKGNWSKDADIPWQAWPGAVAFAAFILFGPQVLRWLLRLAS